MKGIHADHRRWQKHLTKYLRTDTRGMRGKAGGADKNHESGDCVYEKTSEKRIKKEGDHQQLPLKNCGAVGKDKSRRKITVFSHFLLTIFV